MLCIMSWWHAWKTGPIIKLAYNRVNFFILICVRTIQLQNLFVGSNQIHNLTAISFFMKYALNYEII